MPFEIYIKTGEAISIHALRGEGDPHSSSLIDKYDNFNPRPPWGGRLVDNDYLRPLIPFQSTPSVGRATSHICG